MTPGAQTHAERCMVLNSLPFTTLGLIKTLSARQDEVWLQSALDDGHFDFADAPDKNACGTALKKIDAALEFMKYTAFESVEQQEEGGPTTVLKLRTSPEFNAFYDAFVDRLADQTEIYQSDKSKLWSGVDWFTPMSNVLIGAIAVNAVYKIGKLMALSESYGNTYHSAEMFGQALQDNVKEVKSRKFKPAFFAMQLGHEDCMKALVAHGASSLKFVQRPQDDTQRSESETVSILETRDDFAPTCSVSAFALALKQLTDETLKQRMPKEPFDNALHRAGLGILEPSQGRFAERHACYTGAFEAQGAYEINPTQSFRMTCMHGRPEIAERIQGAIDWTKLSPEANQDVRQWVDSLPMGLMKEKAQALTDVQMDQALHVVLQRALADGAFHTAFASAPEYNPNGSGHAAGDRIHQPVSLLIDQGRMGIVIECMRQGLDPTVAPCERSLSPIDYAEATDNNAAAHAMRTYLSRQKAMSALEELETPNRTPSP